MDFLNTMQHLSIFVFITCVYVCVCTYICMYILSSDHRVPIEEFKIFNSINFILLDFKFYASVRYSTYNIYLNLYSFSSDFMFIFYIYI